MIHSSCEKKIPETSWKFNEFEKFDKKKYLWIQNLNLNLKNNFNVHLKIAEVKFDKNFVILFLMNQKFDLVCSKTFVSKHL